MPILNWQWAKGQSKSPLLMAHLDLDRQAVLGWPRRSAQAVSTYFGKYPVAKAGLLIVATDGDRIRGGTTFGYDGSTIRIYVGREAGMSAYQNDWILVHEMTHLALPQLPRSALWLQEGNATYVEPIALGSSS